MELSYDWISLGFTAFLCQHYLTKEYVDVKNRNLYKTPNIIFSYVNTKK